MLLSLVAARATADSMFPRSTDSVFRRNTTQSSAATQIGDLGAALDAYRRAEQAEPGHAAAQVISISPWDRELRALALEPPPPPPRTKWTRRVPHPVLIGHAASLTPY